MTLARARNPKAFWRALNRSLYRLSRRTKGRAPLAGALLCLTLGISLSLAAFLQSVSRERQSLQQEFRFAAENRISAIQRELQSDFDALASMAAFFRNAPRVTETEFNHFFGELTNGRLTHQGVVAVGWLPRISAAERSAYESEFFTISHLDARLKLVPALPRSEYFPVTRVAPSGNEMTLGLDVNSRSTSSPAIAKARDSGSFALSSRTMLLKDPGDLHSIFVYLPVYRRGTENDTLVARRQNLIGIIAAAVRVRDVVETSLALLRPAGVHVTLHDRSARPELAFLYNHRSRLSGPPTEGQQKAGEPMMNYQRLIRVGDRRWEVICAPAERFLNAEYNWNNWTVLLGGILLSIVTSAYLFLLLNHTAQTRSVVRRRTQQLRTANHAALAASRAKSRFLATVSHEIRTPMNGVLGMTRLLLDAGLSEPQRELAQTVNRSAESLLYLLNDILDFSKLEAGRLELSHSRFSLRKEVDEAIGILSAEALRKGIKLSVEFLELRSEWMTGDPQRLRQVLLNLLSNAIKFTDRGSVQLSVEETGGAEADIQLRFTVRDTGSGISPEDQGKLFKPFSQVDGSDTRKHGGTGLGLAICKQLVEHMGGAIGVESKVGYGSTFWYTVRLQRAEAVESPGVSENGYAERPLNGTGQGAVLLVEDNPVNQKVAKGLLEKLGCKVHVACHGGEALEQWERGNFDVIFMDCQMPVMDGYAATAEIRKREQPGSKAWIIALTASAMKGDRERCIEAGMSDYLTKPIRLDDLTSALQKAAACRVLNT